MSALTVLATGPLCTVQDEGRTGQGALGVGRSGAADRGAYRLANRLVGNEPGAATLEVTFGGLVLRAQDTVTVVTAGARCEGDPAFHAPLTLRAGAELRLGAPASGLRTYLAVRGGVDVEPVLGSRSQDLLSGLGPAVVAVGDELGVGTTCGPMPGVDLAAVREPVAGDLVVRVLPGPRRDWFGTAAWTSLTAQDWAVTSQCNRVGVRLDGDPLVRARGGELPSEGMTRGALQVPPSGLPVLFLADHPVTGGYPVIGYVRDDDVDACGQLRPGQRLRLRG